MELKKLSLKNIINKIRSIILKFKSLIKVLFINKKITFLHKYSNYYDYLEHQKNKTNNPKKIKKWMNDEWEIKYNGFLEIFKRNKLFLKGKSNSICLGSRTGQEVKALRDLGFESIGIDLVAFPPYTIYGDIHNINFENNSIDLIFTNIIDHALYPQKFCSEMERICKPNGIIIIHIQKGITGDEYSENIVIDPQIIINYFQFSRLLENRKIRNTFDSMNWEIILEKNQY